MRKDIIKDYSEFEKPKVIEAKEDPLPQYSIYDEEEDL